jgi:hypothetical protein
MLLVEENGVMACVPIAGTGTARQINEIGG